MGASRFTKCGALENDLHVTTLGKESRAGRNEQACVIGDSNKYLARRRCFKQTFVWMAALKCCAEIRVPVASAVAERAAADPSMILPAWRCSSICKVCPVASHATCLTVYVLVRQSLLFACTL